MSEAVAMLSAYRTHKAELDGRTVIELHDDTRGQTARLLPDMGATCFEYSVTNGVERVDVLDPPPDLGSLAADPTGYGTPILFPFPNRIRDGCWRFRGESHRFHSLADDGHHRHGVVYDRAWRVEALRGDAAGAACVMSLSTEDHPDILTQYPFPFLLEVTYALADGWLDIALGVTNVGEDELPMGIGLHPYFRAPIGGETTLANCTITVPAERYWELDGMLPTGRRRTVSGHRDLRRGRAMAGLELDDVFTDLALEGNSSRCIIDDEGPGMRTTLESDGAFREIVVFTPAGRRAVCLEPYTCPTDSPNLAARGVDAGLTILEPRRTFRGSVRIECVG